jgi:hypothetical protein
MLLRNRLVLSRPVPPRLVLPIVLASLAVLAGCGSSSSPVVVPPPSGSFSNSNLTGTYVFSASGYDQGGSPFAMLGAFTADGTGGNGTGGITGGTVDINDLGFTALTPVVAPISNAAISAGSSYTVGVDGRGKATLKTSTPFGTITLDFVLATSEHGLITEFDNNASGSGTLDKQASGLTQSSLAGSYALSFSGIDAGASGSFASVGAFNLDQFGNVTTGLEDFNDDGFIPYVSQSLSGEVILGPSSTPSTVLNSQSFSLTYDVYAIDATHLKFIEMDTAPILSGDAFSQPSATISGTMAFTLAGLIQGNIATAGGFMVTDGAGTITSSSTEDVNEAGTVGVSLPFSATYASAGTGRFTINNFSGFVGVGSGGSYAAYPSSGGLLMLEIDSAGIMSGAGYPQSVPAPAFASAEGYGMNLTGFNLGFAAEVDDIAEFTAVSGGTITGILDENDAPGGGPTSNLALTSGAYNAVDANGRYEFLANVGNSSVSTLNGAFDLTAYSTDGTTFPFIETDSGQTAIGVIVEQDPTASAAAGVSKPHNVFIPRPMVRAKAAQRKKK